MALGTVLLPIGWPQPNTDRIAAPASGRPCCRYQHWEHLGRWDLAALLCRHGCVGNGATSSWHQAWLWVCSSGTAVRSSWIWAGASTKAVAGLGSSSGFFPKKRREVNLACGLSGLWPWPRGWAAFRGATRGAGGEGAEPWHRHNGEQRHCWGSRGTQPPALHGPGCTAGRALPGAGTSATGCAKAHFIRSPFPFHSCSTFAPIVALSLLPGVVVMKSLYLHKVIVRVIKKKKKEVILINVKSIP